MPFAAPVRDFRFLLDHVVGFKAVTETERFADTDDDTVGAILSEAAKMADEVIAPLQRNGDLNGAVLENGVVRTSPGFKDGYDAIANGGRVFSSGTSSPVLRATAGQGQVRLNLPIPDNSYLIGLRLHVQWLVPDPGPFTSPAVMTRGATIQIQGPCR